MSLNIIEWKNKHLLIAIFLDQENLNLKLKKIKLKIFYWVVFCTIQFALIYLNFALKKIIE